MVQDAGVKAEYAALVRDAVSGDRAAMERLLVRTQETAYQFSLLVCGHPEDAEDVMQESLLKTYQHVKRISDPESFRTGLYSTVRNACLMKRRRTLQLRVGRTRHLDQRGNGSRARCGSVSLDRPTADRWMGGWMVGFVRR